MLLAYSKIDDYRPEVDVSDTATAWTRCLSILEFYEDQIPSANHAMRILNSMKNQVVESARVQGMSDPFPVIRQCPCAYGLTFKSVSEWSWPISEPLPDARWRTKREWSHTTQLEC